MNNSTKPHVSVIIVNYNSGKLLVKALDMLKQQTRLPDRVIIVDNNSSDDSLAHLPELPGLEIITNDTNMGFAKANNLAVSQIDDSDYIVLLNPDAFAEKDWLNALLIAAEKHTQHHFFASKMIDAKTRDHYDGAGDVYHISGRPRRRYHGRLLNEINEEQGGNEVFSPCAGAAMYRCSTFKQLGGFDDSFFCYMEDVDLGFRMQLMGYTGLYVQDAVVYHIGSAISGKQSDFSVYYGHRNLVWTYFKNMPIALLAITLPYHMLLNVITLLYFTYRGQGKVIFKAKKDAVSGLPEILTKRWKIQKSKRAGNRYIWSKLDKNPFKFLFCYSDFDEQIQCSGKVVRRFQNIVKVSLKNSILAPFFYFVYAFIYRYFHIFKQKIDSNQNITSLKQMSGKRKRQLMSTEHINWLVNRVDDDKGDSLHKMDKAKLPEIDISVVTFNSENWIAQFTKSLLKQQYPLQLINLYFVDNSSSDDTLNTLGVFCQKNQDLFASVSVDIRPNLGFGMGHDFAIRKGKSNYIIVCNIDLEFTVNAILEALIMAEADSCLLQDNQASSWAYKVASWEFRQKPYEHPKYYDPITLETSWSSHACILLKRAAYEQVGGYEPAIFMYGEDVELSYRFRKAGYQLKYNPFAVVQHYSYKQTKEIKPNQFCGAALSNAYIRLAYGTLYDQLLIAPLQLAKLIKGGGFSGSRRALFNNTKKIWCNLAYFLKKNNNENVGFPFHGFDYEMTRDGAFYHGTELSNEQLPLVTIVTRTYKGRNDWLKECIASVMHQTYPNIQHVIVEDGGSSMENMLNDIIEKYKGCYNLNYQHLPKVGRSCAGNKGMEAADGQWLMFLDDDDLILADHVEVLLSSALNAPGIDATYSLSWDVQTEIQNESLSEKESSLTMDSDQLNYEEKFHATSQRYYQEYSLDRLFEQNYIPIQSILFKRKLFEQYGGFDEDIEYLEDWLLWIKYAINHKFLFVKKTTSLFRTPYSLQEQIKRKLNFDKVYKEIISKQNELRQQCS